jgi:hypothetical protein
LEHFFPKEQAGMERKRNNGKAQVIQKISQMDKIEHIGTKYLILMVDS